MLTSYDDNGTVTIRLSDEQSRLLKELLSDERYGNLKRVPEYQEHFTLTMFRLQLAAELDQYM